MIGFEAADVLAALVLEDGARWGEVAHDVQWEDAHAILDQGSATPLHFLTRARGFSKTTDLAALCLAIMTTQLPPGGRLFAIAAGREQARILLDAASGFIERTPLLAGAFDVQRNRIILKATDITLKILAADSTQTWGLLPHFFVVDELAQWPTTREAQRLWEAHRDDQSPPRATCGAHHRRRSLALVLRRSQPRGQ